MFLLLCTGIAKAQCPQNIGFDFGDFTNWQGATGGIAADGTIAMTSQGIVSGRHTIFYAKDKQIDPYGKFLIASPNGSSCCVRLGNTNANKQAEQLTYTFTVPANDPDYSLIYYYACVLQNPGHLPYQEPRFTANVFDVTDNQYISCGGYLFEASSNLPGFKTSSVSNTVLYKDWSAVTVNLLGYSGKTLRLEFTTNACSLGAHFGYAYLDINQNCTSPVSGNVYCGNTTGSATLIAPAGFQAYYWYKGTDYSNIIGQNNVLIVNPAPTVGTTYSVRIVPYPGIGCEDTIHTTIQQTEPLILKLKDTITQCKLPSVDLTDTSIVSGSTSDFTYTYYTDSLAVNSLIGPQAVTKSGTYYIQGTTPGGCSVIKPIVLLIGQANLNITNPPPVCVPSTVDLTASAVTAGSGAGTLTYWLDTLATNSLANPKAVTASGTYYIKLISPEGCTAIKAVKTIINSFPTLAITNPAQNCGITDITAPAITKGSSTGATYTYYTDSLCTAPIANPTNVTISGKVYIKASVPGGCYTVAPIMITPPETLNLVVPDSVTVCVIPGLDLTKPAITAGSNTDFTYSYFSDPSGTTPLPNPKDINASGTYYIKATTPLGCSVIKPVKVIALAVGNFTITDPPQVCEPVTVDITKAINYSANFTGTIGYWKDAAATIALNNPTAVDSTGTYYVQSLNSNGCPNTQPVHVIVNKLPVVNITDQSGCYFVDITNARATAGSSTGLNFTYWLDAAATRPLLAPQAIPTSGTYYISGTTAAGCTVTKPINVNVYSSPAIITITNPPPVVYPEVVDLRTSFTPQKDIFYTFWTDSALTKLLTSPLVTKGGKYYIKATNSNGCYNQYTVVVTVNKPPDIDFTTNVFTPNGDGVNDGFKFKVPFYVNLKSFKIYNKLGQLLFQTSDPNKYWDGKVAGQFVPVATYYWIFEAYDNYSQVEIKKAGSISVVR
ncbi:gliding motility-associated C-terminal domain-containing protein [uncultured Mucilaginibacter sp.]|uniref:T9SS type B sorting domain-containing protein n=1 Tax=uncultured Mucilaginibacter sp. TaxID=797541 RepID=UPI0025F2E860|nr:gliding motility-associated C-terminal domain-containing protein [uncultured Mucilaginibacter sp.]